MPYRTRAGRTKKSSSIPHYDADVPDKFRELAAHINHPARVEMHFAPDPTARNYAAQLARQGTAIRALQRELYGASNEATRLAGDDPVVAELTAQRLYYDWILSQPRQQGGQPVTPAQLKRARQRLEEIAPIYQREFERAHKAALKAVKAAQPKTPRKKAAPMPTRTNMRADNELRSAHPDLADLYRRASRLSSEYIDATMSAGYNDHTRAMKAENDRLWREYETLYAKYAGKA